MNVTGLDSEDGAGGNGRTWKGVGYLMIFLRDCSASEAKAILVPRWAIRCLGLPEVLVRDRVIGDVSLGAYEGR